MEKPSFNRQAVETLCVAHGIDSYAELARRCGKDRTYVSRVMRGERPAQPSLIVAIAKELGVAPLALLGPSDPEAAEADLLAAATDEAA